MEVKTERPPYVQWERKPVEDREQTNKTGSFKTKDMDFVIVTPVGSKDRIPHEVQAWFGRLEQNVREGRFSQEWLTGFKASYEAWKTGQELPLTGTPIKGWSVLSPAQQANVINATILTVEDLANANDEARKRIGMGANDFVQKAITWLKSANDLGKVTQEMSALKVENDALKTQVSNQQEMLVELKKQIDALKAK